jgi:hypothetical protein
MAEHGGVSPVTGEMLETRALMRNAALQAVIDDLFPRVEPRDLAIPEQSVADLTNQDLISCVQVSYQPDSAVAIFFPHPHHFFLQWRQLMYVDSVLEQSVCYSSDDDLAPTWLGPTPLQPILPRRAFSVLTPPPEKRNYFRVVPTSGRPAKPQLQVLHASK